MKGSVLVTHFSIEIIDILGGLLINILVDFAIICCTILLKKNYKKTSVVVWLRII